jgi:hypothetical protein
MSRSRWLVLYLIFGFLYPAYADNPKAPSTKELIDQLSHPRFSVREKAFSRLQSGGADAIPELKKALNHPKEEVRSQIAKLIPMLEKMVLLEPKRITLQIEQEPLSFILQQIEKQTGYKVESQGENPKKRYSFVMKELPFWEAIEKIRQETGRTILTYTVDDEKKLQSYPTRSRFVSNHGIFRVEVSKLHEDHDLDFEENLEEALMNQKPSSIKLSLAVLVEPKFQLLSFDSPILEFVIDQENRSFIPPVREKIRDGDNERDNIPEYHFEMKHDQYRQSINLELLRPTNASKCIQKIRGVVPVMIIVKKRQIVLCEKVIGSNRTQFQFGEEAFELTSAEQRESGGVEIALWIHNPDYENRRKWLDRFQLTDSSGTGHPASGRGIGSSDGGIPINLYFMERPEAGRKSNPKLLFEEWVTVRCEIPFEFKNIPLP